MNTAFSGSILHAARDRKLPLVADIKSVSPRDGDLFAKRDPVSLARTLEGAGVCALSVVTESAHFGGSLDLLRRVAGSVGLPILRKDFIKSAAQIDETVEAGGAAILLILSTIPEGEIVKFYGRAVEVGLEPLVEIHTPEQLRFALSLEPGPTIIGINNRDITALEKDDGDVRVTEEIAPLVPDGVVVLSESSISSPGDVRRAFAAGSDAVLVGTAILMAPDPASQALDLAGSVLEG